jgi:hypothetical protein
MTTKDFRHLALSFPEAVESAHMNHPDFRVRGKIFTTLVIPMGIGRWLNSRPRNKRSWFELTGALFGQ